MVKFSKVKRVSSDVILKKKQITDGLKTINPFEVHQNKEKFKILGRKNKHDHGLPGVSRGKAVKKRKETLGKEFQTRNKVNTFTDRRHQSYANEMNDEVSNARFVTLQQNRFNKQKKSDLFNLNDEEILTHKGQTLEEIEQFENEGSDESEVDEALNADFTETAHFGGGGHIAENDRKSAIEDMIIEAKRRKAEISKEREEVFRMTSKLDESYKMLLPQLGKLSSKTNNIKSQTDEYDKIMREMIFEPRGEVTDKLKSEEEIAKEEKLRLEKLEKERLARMRGEESLQEKPKHISADELDRGYYMESDGEDDKKNIVLSYDTDGKTNVEKLANKLSAENEKIPSEDEKSEADEEEEEEDEDSDDLMDLKYTETTDDENTDIEKNCINGKQKNSTSISYTEFEKSEEITHIIEMPSSYQKFLSMLSEKQPETQAIILQQIIKCNHPKLDGSNRKIIAKLFDYVLKYVDSIFEDSYDIKNAFRILDQIMPQLYDIVQINSKETCEHILETLKEKYLKYNQNIKKIPNIETLIIFKIISNLYSTSDFRHPIVTPSIVFISQILFRCNFRSRKDISLGLFIVSIVLEFTNLSKRFFPAVSNFLLRIIFLAVPKNLVQVFKNIPSSESSVRNNILFLADPNKKVCDNKLSSDDLISNDAINDNFKVLALNTTLKLIKEYADIITENVGSRYIAAEFLKLMEQLNLENYPEFVNENYLRVKSNLDATMKTKLTKLVAPIRKPKVLRLFEPKIEKIYDDKRRPKMSEEKTMRAIMVHKVKRETKGAEREIRRDTQFLNKIRIKEQIKSDLERKEKVKRIFAEASVQQGELNEFQRQRKKTKF